MFLFLILVFLIKFTSASLGITPAIEDINFEPGKIREFTFSAYSDDPNKEIELYLDGDLKDYAVISKQKAIGSAAFKVTLNFPQSFDVPGKHALYVRAKEAPPEGQFIGTRIDVGALIRVFVPYPGRYLEMYLNVPDINVDEKLPVDLKFINRGRDNLELSEVYVDFFTNGNKISNLDFSPIYLNVTEEKAFKKFLDTTSYKPGYYIAKAIANYGDASNVNKTFRIGSLFVNITNFTDSVIKGGIKKFYVGVESGWNGKIENVYAEVNITGSSKGDLVFRTPSVDLSPFEQKTIESFFDTEEYEAGKYNIKISLNYLGEKTIVEGILKISEVNYLLIGIIIAVLVLILIVVIIIFIKRNKSRKYRK